MCSWLLVAVGELCNSVVKCPGLPAVFYVRARSVTLTLRLVEIARAVEWAKIHG